MDTTRSKQAQVRYVVENRYGSVCGSTTTKTVGDKKRYQNNPVSMTNDIFETDLTGRKSFCSKPFFAPFFIFQIHIINLDFPKLLAEAKMLFMEAFFIGILNRGHDSLKSIFALITNKHCPYLFSNIRVLDNESAANVNREATQFFD